MHTSLWVRAGSLSESYVPLLEGGTPGGITEFGMKSQNGTLCKDPPKSGFGKANLRVSLRLKWLTVRSSALQTEGERRHFYGVNLFSWSVPKSVLSRAVSAQWGLSVTSEVMGPSDVLPAA